MKAKIISRLLIFCMFFLTHHLIHVEEKQHISVKIISEVADITDDIAELIINCKREKNPQITKSSIVKLIQHIASITEAIIEKKSENKQTRSFEFNPNDIQSDELLQILADTIIEQVNQKQSVV